MESRVDDEMLALACVPSAIPAAQRVSHFAQARDLLKTHAIEKRELADGYEFRFEAGQAD